MVIFGKSLKRRLDVRACVEKHSRGRGLGYQVINEVVFGE
jgi:hypothetical protein